MITIKYFASLREAIGTGERLIDSTDVNTIADIIALHEAPLPDNTLIALNQVYADPADVVKDGDEVGLFPPVTGG